MTTKPTPPPAAPVSFTLHVRVPSWAVGTAVECAGAVTHRAGGWLLVEKLWRPGDAVVVNFGADVQPVPAGNGAGAPVAALLPEGATKARFFVPETEVAALAPGQAVQISCDGCGAPITARISRVATQAEYAPPVIYSNAQRAKLVFMVEARPDPADARRLRPGLPLDVRPAASPRNPP